MRLWAMRTRPLEKNEVSRLMDMLPQTLQASLLAGGTLRQDALWAYSLLRKAVRDTFDMQLPQIIRKAEGKPYFEGYSKVFFNISHTDGAVLVGISDREIGVDIEKDRTPPVRVRKMLRVEEDCFFAEWVRWEACAKCSGKSVLSVLRKKESPKNMTYRAIESFSGYFAGVAVQGSAAEGELLYIEPDALFGEC